MVKKKHELILHEKIETKLNHDIMQFYYIYLYVWHSRLSEKPCRYLTRNFFLYFMLITWSTVDTGAVVLTQNTLTASRSFALLGILFLRCSY